MTLTRRAVVNLLSLADMRPAFRDDALRMIGGLPGHPVTRAIRNGALRSDPPDWKDGHAVLRYVASLLSDALTRVIADRKLPFEHLPNWDCTLSALNRVFGIDLHHHFLHAAPLEWLEEAWLTEPQITRGFAHCLDAGGRTTRTGRIRALLRALGSDPGDADSSLREAWATPEAPANGRRIELLIEWTDASRRKRGAVIEAKFGHRVTRRQLRDYRTHLKRIETDYRREVPANQRERPLLFLVSPLRNAGITRALGRQWSQDWRWMSWRSLLLAYDRVLDPDLDDDAFRRFRRTLWDRAG